MANALIQPATSSSAQVTCVLYDPRLERQHRERFFRQGVGNLALANSLAVSSGLAPARGWILLRRGDYDRLDRYSTSLQLHMDDLSRAPVIARDLAIVQARCFSTGISSDPNAIYLVEITDARGLLYNQWFQFPTTSGYNIRSPAYPQEYYDFSLSLGLPHTWDSMVSDLWTQMNAALGVYPGLPFIPDDTPEGWWFPGCSGWVALNMILDKLGCTVAADLTAAAPYTIVQGGAADLAFAAQQALYARLLEDDLEYIDVGAGRVPASVVVYFHRRNEFYGTEETIRRDSLQWAATPLYSVTASAPAFFAGATGVHHIWSDFSVRYDEDNNPLVADVAQAALIAQQETNQYFDRIYSGTSGFMRQTYTGVLPMKTGSMVDGVRWRQDFSRERMGWVTDIIRGPRPAWQELEIDVDD